MRTVSGSRVGPRRTGRGRGGGRRSRTVGVVVVIALVVAGVLLARRGATAQRESPSAALVDAPFVVRGQTIPPERLRALLAARLGFTSRGGEMRCAYAPLGEPGTPARATDGAVAHLYVEVLCLELVRDGDSLATGSGRGGPALVSVMADGDSLRLQDVRVPPDGAGYAAGVRRLFPVDVARRFFIPGPRTAAARRAMERVLRQDAARRLGLPERPDQ